jgi:hypothetical protein
MAMRLPASQHTREELTALIEGRLSTASAKDELVKLATESAFPETINDFATKSARRRRFASWHSARASTKPDFF